MAEGAPKRSLAGNWVEEMAPKLNTIIAHSGAEDTKALLVSSAQRDFGGAATSTYSTQGRRQKLLEDELRKIAAEPEEQRPEKSYFETEAQASFYDNSSQGRRENKIGQRVMKTQTGEPLPEGQRDTGFLDTFMGTKKAAKLSDDELAAARPNSDVNTEFPVSIYSQLAKEGKHGGTKAIGGANNPFAKSTRFSNDIRDPINVTEE